MKKRTIYLLILVGLLLSLPFNYLMNTTGYHVQDYWLRVLGLAAMVGVILILIGLLNLSTVIEFKIIVRKKTAND